MHHWQGHCDTATISKSYSSATILGSGRNVGGLVGYLNASTASIDQSYATGDVSTTTTGNSQAGGLIGRMAHGSVSNSYSTGTVSGATAYIGGLIGTMEAGTLTNSYTVGNLNLTGTGQTSFIGGLVGNKGTATITNSFYDKTVSAGRSDATYGKTTAEFADKATFSAWDIVEDSSSVRGYPKLRMADSGAVWTIRAPIATGGDGGGTTVDAIINAIASGIAVQPPVIPTFTPPAPPTPAPQQFSFGGQPVQLMSTPSGGTPTQVVTMQEIRQMQQDGGNGGGNPGEIRIPLMQGSLIDLVNGGVKLPENVEQEFFMAQR